MRSDLWQRTMSSSLVRRLIPWAVVALVGALLLGIMPSAQAQTGASVPENSPLLPVIRIAAPALLATGPAVGVDCGVAGLVAEVAVGVASVEVGVRLPTKLTERSG